MTLYYGSDPIAFGAWKSPVGDALSIQWREVQVAVLGVEAGYPLASFNSGASISSTVYITDGTYTAPRCGGYNNTFETNNLNNSCYAPGGSNLYVIFNGVNNETYTPPSQHTVLAVQSTGGKIEPSGVVPTPTNKAITFKLTPDSGYFVQSISVRDGDKSDCWGTWGRVSGSSSNWNYTTKPIATDCSIKPVFARQ
jgi:hypothetical protein